ncbi:MAG: hypothetical protein H6696_13920 [Deferribacteres bacterium]|nr:hypothetical protein [candidate division KSB1 bacterium]MCB9503024.1 hypothetical protein [Deferribacteres bacterium]
MKNIKFICSLLCAIILFTSGLHAQDIKQKDGYYTTIITKSFKVKSGGMLDVRVANGYYNVQGWEKQEVAIEELIRTDVYSEEEAELTIARSKSEYQQDGGDVRVFSRGGDHAVFHSFTIKLPNKYDIKLKTSRGDVDIKDVAGDLNLNTAGGEIRVNRCGGKVDARTSGGDIEIENSNATLEIHASGGDIKIETVDGDINASTSGGDIDLINTKQSARIRTSGGDLIIRNAQGNIRGSTSGGSITAINCAKDIKINTSGGNIELQNIGGSIDASTSGGDIEGENLRGPSELATSGGDVEIKQVQNSIQAKTMGGSIEVEMTVSDFSRTYTVDLVTVSGDLELEIPEKMATSIQAEIRLDRNRRYWKRYDILSDFPLTKKTTNDNQQPALVSEGEINGGGSTIYLSTSNGNITLKKAK